MFGATFYANVRRNADAPRKDLSDVVVVSEIDDQDNAQRLRKAFFSRIHTKPPTSPPQQPPPHLPPTGELKITTAAGIDRRQSVPITIPLNFKRTPPPSKQIGLTRSQPIDIPTHRRTPTAPMPLRARSRYLECDSDNDDPHYRFAIEQWTTAAHIKPDDDVDVSNTDDDDVSGRYARRDDDQLHYQQTFGDIEL